jgi:hypothetical protein
MDAASRGGGTWDSGLSVEGFAAVRSAGFEPVGQVFGAAVYYLATVAGASCPGTSAGLLPRDAGSVRGFRGPDAQIAQGLYKGRRTAIDRMTAQCADLGGHGIVAAVPRVTEVPATSLTAAAIEFTVAGTAVRARGRPAHLRPVRPGLREADHGRLGTGRDRSGHLGRRAARRTGDDQLRSLGCGERGGAVLHRPDNRGTAGCACPSGAVGPRTGR